MSAEVVNLAVKRANKAGDNRLCTPLDALQAMAADIQSGEVKCDKLVILCLDTSDEGYQVTRDAVNMRSSEIVALMEYVKTRALIQLGAHE